MNICKRILALLLITSVHNGFSTDKSDDNQLVLTVQEIESIKLCRALRKMNDCLNAVAVSHDKNFFDNGTNPSRTESLKIQKPLFKAALENFMSDFASCYQTIESTCFGWSTMQLLHIIDATETKVIQSYNKELLKILTQAITYFEREKNSDKDFPADYTSMNINLFLTNSDSFETVSLHDIKQAFEKLYDIA